jgi:hypothetical protein
MEMLSTVSAVSVLITGRRWPAGSRKRREREAALW